MLRARQNLYPLLLLALSFRQIHAQNAFDSIPLLPSPSTTSTSTFPSSSPNPFNGDLSSTNAPPAPTTDPGTGDDGHRDGLLNYYFLIIAIFVVMICLIYWTLLRRRRHQRLQSQTHQTYALNQDLSSPHPYPRGPGRWRRWRPGGGSRDTTYGTTFEGLNERGEAPPPYVKEPDRAHMGSRGSQSTHDIELGSITGKPPDYEDGRRFAQR